MMEWLKCHECARRALRTFIQTAAGVLVAAIINASGVISDLNVGALVILAVATGLSAVMNLSGGQPAETEEETEEQTKS